MKKLFIITCAALAAFASCNKEQGQQSRSGNVDFTLTAGLPQATRALNLTGGGLTNAAGDYSVRFIFEVFDADGEFVRRFVRYENLDATGTTFNTSLLADQYTFVVWADFVNKQTATGDVEYDDAETGSPVDLYYKTSDNLRNIAIIDGTYTTTAAIANGGRMLRDAYTSTQSADLRTVAANVNMTLTRPFGRVQVTSTAMGTIPQLGFETPAKVSVTYNSINNGYDAFLQDVLSTTKTAAQFTEDIDDYTNDTALISYDYLFAPKNGQGSATFTLQVQDAGSAEVISHQFAAVPFERNKITQITGALFGQYVMLAVTIDDQFAGTIDNYEDLGSRLDEIQDGGTLELPAGTYKANLSLDKNVTIKGEDGQEVEIYAANPETITIPGQVANVGAAPAVAVTGNVTVNMENVTISTNQTTGNLFDGITVMNGATLNLTNVTFDGIMQAQGLTGVQTGRCITVYGGATLNADGCTFKNYNKNAVDVVDGIAHLSNCTVIGSGINKTANPEQAAAGLAAQNGFVFRDNSTGSVTDCHFSNITYYYNNASSAAILLYQVTNRLGITLSGNGFTNCEGEVVEQ